MGNLHLLYSLLVDFFMIMEGTIVKFLFNINLGLITMLNNISHAVAEAVILNQLSYQEAWEMVNLIAPLLRLRVSETC